MQTYKLYLMKQTTENWKQTIFSAGIFVNNQINWDSSIVVKPLRTGNERIKITLHAIFQYAIKECFTHSINPFCCTYLAKLFCQDLPLRTSLARIV